MTPPHPHTIAVHAGRPPHEPGEALSVPPVLASTFVSGGEINYGRDDNPSWRAFEEAVGDLEGGTAVAYASGMAAVAAVFDTVPVGERIVAPQKDAYSGTRELLRDLHDRGRIVWVPVDIADTAAVLEALEGAALLWIETPTNPLLRIADLTALLDGARRAGVAAAVDNTFATPLLQRPLERGADYVVHSATKLLSGHSDVVIGVAVTPSREAAEPLIEARTLRGPVAGALDAFLALRGLRTLGVRLERAQDNAAELARRLDADERVAAVHYPGLTSHPGHERAAAHMDGFGTMLSFEVETADAADAVCEALQVIVPATSLGGVETTIERRAKYAGDAHVAPGLLRVSVGIENVEDLWRDLDAALRR